jgi:hypothetical protein
MSRGNASFPQRGETFYQGGTIDLNNLQGVNLEGQVKDFEDIQWDSSESAKPTRTGSAPGAKVRCMLVRNLSGATLHKKRLASINPLTKRVDGYTITTAQRGFPIDEFLPDTGVPNGDLFWVVIAGRAIIRTLMSGQTADIAAGDLIVAATVNSASTAAGTTGTPGRPDSIAISALTTAAQGLAVLRHARYAMEALSAATTGQTNTDLLVEVQNVPATQF